MERFQLRNVLENYVIEKAKDILESQEMCNCEKCIMDVSAIALNRLPPKYVVTNKGEIYSKINLLILQFETDIVTAVTHGIKIVRENPHR
jgi:competence protein ComFB